MTAYYKSSGFVWSSSSVAKPQQQRTSFYPKFGLNWCLYKSFTELGNFFTPTCKIGIVYNTLYTQYQQQNKSSNGFNTDNFKPG